jgi:hypothetical protein
MAYELAGTALGLLLLGLTLLLLFAWQPKRPRGAKPGAAAAEGLDAVEALLAIGSLTAIILPLLPTLKPHYYALLLPLATGLAAAWLERPSAAGRARQALVAAFAYACAPGFLYHALRRLGLDELALGLGLDTYAGLALWAAGLMVLGARNAASARPPPRARARLSVGDALRGGTDAVHPDRPKSKGGDPDGAGR